MYWILASERADENELSIDGVPSFFDQLNIDFSLGKSISKSFPIIELSYTNADGFIKTDNIAVSPRLGLLISDRVKTIFKRLGIENVQLFKSKLIDLNTNDVDESYDFVNIVGILSCIDQNKSELEFYNDGQIEFIDSLVLNIAENEVRSHIFRIAEYPSLIVISDELKEQLEKFCITGVKIYAPEDFSL